MRDKQTDRQTDRRRDRQREREVGVRQSDTHQRTHRQAVTLTHLRSQSKSTNRKEHSSQFPRRKQNTVGSFSLESTLSFKGSDNVKEDFLLLSVGS